MPGSGGGHRRRRHRLRVRLDASPTSAPRSRSSRRCPRSCPGVDNDVANVVVRSFKKQEHRRPHRREGHRPHARRARRHDGARSATARRSRSTPSSSRSAAARCRRRASASTAPGSTVDERGFVEVDEFCRTGEPRRLRRRRPHRHAAARPRRLRRGDLVIKDILGEEAAPGRLRPGAVGIYCHPEVAFAGYSEQAAKEAGYDVVVSKHRFIGNSRALILGETDGLVKIIAEKQADGTGRPDPRRAHGRARGSPSSWARATWPSTGRPPSTRSPQFIQPHPSLSRAVRRDRAGAHRPQPHG